MTTGTRLNRQDNEAPNIYTGGLAITTSDANELATYSNGIYVGGAGAVKVTTLDGSVLTFAAVPVGTILPVAAKLVWATGTTATLLLGLY